MKQTSVADAARIEDNYRKGDGFSEIARALGISERIVQRVVKDSGLERTPEEQLDITTELVRKRAAEAAKFTLGAMGLKTAGKDCIGCQLPFYVAIEAPPVIACPFCVYATKQRLAGNMRPIFWGLR